MTGARRDGGSRPGRGEEEASKTELITKTALGIRRTSTWGLRAQRKSWEAKDRPVATPESLIVHRFQNSCEGIRKARLKRDDEFSHAMIIVNSAMVSSS